MYSAPMGKSTREPIYKLSMNRIVAVTGLHYSTVWDALRGSRNPKVGTARVIAAALGMKLDDLWGKE